MQKIQKSSAWTIHHQVMARADQLLKRVTREMKRTVLRASTALWHCPCDVLRWSLDRARLALLVSAVRAVTYVNTVLRVDDKLLALGVLLCSFGVLVLVHCGRADSSEKASVLWRGQHGCFLSFKQRTHRQRWSECVSAWHPHPLEDAGGPAGFRRGWWLSTKQR